MAQPIQVIDQDGPVIVGAGLAGLTAALNAAPRPTLVISPTPLGTAASTAWAQGGVAAALATDDAPALHAADTLAAGDGLCDPAMVDLLTTEGPDAVRALLALGAPFDREADGGFSLSLEAAHSRARVARVGGDGAGAAILKAVIAAAQAAPHIEILEGARLTGLIQSDSGAVVGVWLDRGGETIAVRSPAVVLATGGIGGLYAVTTNPASALGEGLALAALAGATIADPEFVQFHPTALDVGADPAPLVTEALRGEGAILVNRDGTPFMARYDAAAELAPRHIVAQAVHAEIAAGRGVALDARASVGGHFPQAFPAVFAACMAAGIDPRTSLIPVAPAAHYHMGGIATDRDGRASLEGLFAAGECAATGVQGANRLASNSLLEAAVFGRRTGLVAAQAGARSAAPLPPPPVVERLPAAALAGLRQAMAREAGVVREAQGLGALLERIDGLQARHPAAAPLVAAGLVAQAALDRRESRGGHLRSDFPQKDAIPHRTFVTLDDARRQKRPVMDAA